MKQANQKKAFFQNFGRASLVHAISKFLGSFRESFLVGSLDKDVSDAFYAGSKIPASVRRVCGEGCLELASVSFISRLASDKEMQAFWVRKWQEIMFYISLVVCLLTSSLVGLFNLEEMARDLFIINLQSVPIYILCAFWSSACNFNQNFLMSGLAQGFSNIIICPMLTLPLFSFKHSLCLVIFISTISYLACNLLAVSSISIHKRPAWVLCLRDFVSTILFGFVIFFAITCFVLNRSSLLAYLMDLCAIFFIFLSSP